MGLFISGSSIYSVSIHHTLIYTEYSVLILKSRIEESSIITWNVIYKERYDHL